MLLSLPHASRSDLRVMLFKWACRYSPIETSRDRIVERTIVSVITDPDSLEGRPIDQALHYVSHAIAKEEIGVVRSIDEIPGNGLAGRRYLVVEDDYLIAMDLVKTLDEAGATVLGPVCDVERALEVASDRGFALDGAILDIRLGSEMVYPAAAELIRRNTPFLFLSGYDRKVVPPAFDRIPYLMKPCGDEELISALTAITLRRVPHMNTSLGNA